MADLVVREIEAKARERVQAEAAAAAGEEHMRLLRESMRFLPATVLIDTGPDGWTAHRSAGLFQVSMSSHLEPSCLNSLRKPRCSLSTLVYAFDGQDQARA